MGVNLMRTLSDILKIELDPIKLFEYTTVDELADYICTDWPEVMGEVAQQPAIAGRRDGAIKEMPLGSEANSEYRFTRKAQLAEAGSATESFQDKTQHDVLHEPIVIIGMSGRFAETESLDEFWQSLKEGKNLVKRYRAGALKSVWFRNRLNTATVRPAVLLSQSINSIPHFLGFQLAKRFGWIPVMLFLEECWKGVGICWLRRQERARERMRRLRWLFKLWL